MIDETAGFEPPTSDDRLIWNVWLSVYHFPTLAVADALGVFPLLQEASASSRGEADSISRTWRETSCFRTAPITGAASLNSSATSPSPARLFERHSRKTSQSATRARTSGRLTSLIPSKP